MALKKHIATNEGGSLVGIVVRSAVAAGLVAVLYGTGSLSGMQAAWADAFERVFRPTPSSKVAVVAITDDDYDSRDLFGSTSPLDPAVLTRLFVRLAAHRPATVAIDIQLHPPAYEPAEREASRRELYATLERLSRSHDTRWILIDSEGSTTGNTAAQAAWQALHGPSTDGEGYVTWASAELKAEDGLVRTIALCTAPQPNVKPLPTVLGALIAVDAQLQCPSSANTPTRHQRIRFTGAFSQTAANAGSGLRLSAGAILTPAEAPLGDTILTGKTVLVGGAFRAGRDEHWTALGTMNGVELWAEGFDSWIRQDALYEPHWLGVFLLQTGIGIASGWLTLHLSTFWGQAVAILGMGLLTGLFTWISFGAGFIVASSLPSFFAAQMHTQFGSLPTVVADHVSRAVDRRRRERRAKQRERQD